jgi:LVIVD repeat
MTSSLRILALAPLLGTLGVAAATASCAATPTPVPVRTFERAQKVDFVCLNLGGKSISPATPDQCPPVPANVNGSLFQYHYFAVVTQTTRGELAVVDLTAGTIIDEDQSTPGVQFIPVGRDPAYNAVLTDVAVSPDGAFTFTSSANPNLPALYGVDNTHLLGDSLVFDQQSQYVSKGPPLQGVDVGCSLPQPPDAIAITPGAPNAAGSAAPNGYSIAVLLRAWGGQPARVVMVDHTSLVPWNGLAPPLCGELGSTGALSASLAGASSAPGPDWSDGVPYATVGNLAKPETELSPGRRCAWPPPGLVPPAPSDSGGAAEAEPSDVDASFDVTPSDAQPEGAFSDASVDATLSDAQSEAAPSDAQSEGARSNVSPEAGLLDAGVFDAAAANAAPLPAWPLDDPHPTSMVLRDLDAPVLYVADRSVPIIHVIDVSNASAPLEVSSFLATSQAQPDRRVAIGALALSQYASQLDPATGRHKRFLYAVDISDGSLMVFDATLPVPAPFTPPLERPHPELNPFAPRDRLAFPAPVAAVAFVHHEWPVRSPNATFPYNAYPQLLCNPNPNARLDGGAVVDDPAAYGAYLGADQASLIVPQGTVQAFPSRLRGDFAFVTLTNGSIEVVDVDDWDAPCRRPDPMTPTDQTGALDIQEDPPSSPADLNPYHAPFAYPPGLGSSVTLEVFFPVSAPHRVRSGALLRNDTTTGDRVPHLAAVPQLFSSTGAPVGVTPAPGTMLPTALPPGFFDPSSLAGPASFGSDAQAPGGDAQTPASDAQADSGADAGTTIASGSGTVPNIRVSFDDPTAHVDQDWVATYEGVLPTASSLVSDMSSLDDYQTLTLSLGGRDDAGAGKRAKGGGFCELGIEDWNLGQDRANQAVVEMTNSGLPPPKQLSQWTADYIEITDDLLAAGDPYWSQPTAISDSGLPVNTCWADTGLQGDPARDPALAGKRYNECAADFGAAGSGADAQLGRDFPILEAYDGALVIGRFGWVPSKPGDVERTTSRVVVGADPSNKIFLKLAMCCFRHQTQFKVRTGGEWVTVGQNGIGLLHHVVTDPQSGRCVLSCDPRSALLNARAFDVPFAPQDQSLGGCTPHASIDRKSPLAMRNPMFSFVIWSGCNPSSTATDAAVALDAGNTTDGGGVDNSHTATQRDESWRFSMRGGFTPLTISLSGASGLPVTPQSMRLLAPNFHQLAIVDGSSQGLVLIDLHTLLFAHSPYF